MPIGQYIIVEKGRLFHPNLNHSYSQVMVIRTFMSTYHGIVLNCVGTSNSTGMAFNPWHANGFTVPWGEGDWPPFLSKRTKT